MVYPIVYAHMETIVTHDCDYSN